MARTGLIWLTSREKWCVIVKAAVNHRTIGFHKMTENFFNPLSAELNAICHFLTLLGAHHILHFSRVRINGLGTTSFSRKILLNGIIGFVGWKQVCNNHFV